MQKPNEVHPHLRQRSKPLRSRHKLQPPPFSPQTQRLKRGGSTSHSHGIESQIAAAALDREAAFDVRARTDCDFYNSIKHLPSKQTACVPQHNNSLHACFQLYSINAGLRFLVLQLVADSKMFQLVS